MNLTALLNNAELLKALIPVLTPIVIAAIRLGVPRVPSKFYPLLAALIGVGLDALAHFTAGATLAPAVGLALGLAGVGLREAKDQLAKPRP